MTDHTNVNSSAAMAHLAVLANVGTNETVNKTTSPVNQRFAHIEYNVKTGNLQVKAGGRGLNRTDALEKSLYAVSQYMKAHPDDAGAVQVAFQVRNSLENRIANIDQKKNKVSASSLKKMNAAIQKLNASFPQLKSSQPTSVPRMNDTTASSLNTLKRDIQRAKATGTMNDIEKSRTMNLLQKHFGTAEVPKLSDADFITKSAALIDRLEQHSAKSSQTQNSEKMTRSSSGENRGISKPDVVASRGLILDKINGLKSYSKMDGASTDKGNIAARRSLREDILRELDKHVSKDFPGRPTMQDSDKDFVNKTTSMFLNPSKQKGKNTGPQIP